MCGSNLGLVIGYPEVSRGFRQCPQANISGTIVEWTTIAF